MDIQLKELLEQIRTDGVRHAEEKAAKILAGAESGAQELLEKARKSADDERAQARAEKERQVQAGQEALRQAGRDLMIQIKDDIQSLYRGILEQKIAGELDGELLGKAILLAVEQLAAGQEAVDVHVPENLGESLSAQLQGELARSLKQDVRVTPVPGLDAGFRISGGDGTAFFDFSERELAGMLSHYLGPRLARLLDQ